jgi:dihydrolipoamide dehydrogenase
LDITGINRSNRLAGLTDPAVVASLQETLQQEFPIYTGTAAEVQSGSEKLTVHFGGKRVQADKVLASLGRRPNLATLGLKELGLQLDEHGLPPYDPTTLQMDNLPIFIAGDANADSPVLHEAADEGRIAGFNSVQEKPHCFQRRMKLSIVFSEPNVAVVGSSFSELQDQDIAIGEVCFNNQGRAKVMAENVGVLRLYGDKKNGRLVGAELAAPRGEHVAHLLAWAMQQELTVFEMLQLPFYHPVVEEGLRSALRDLSKQIYVKRPVFELAMCDSQAIANMN